MSKLSHLSRFDRAVVGALLGLALAIALVIWRGDQVGMQVQAISPAPSSNGVSTQAKVRVDFDQTVATPSQAISLTFDPPVFGEVRSNGESIVFAPARALAPDTAYTVTLAAGVRSEQGRMLLQPLTWQFQTGQVQVVYSTANAQGQEQLFMAPVQLQPGDGQQQAHVRQLTDAPFGIWDYAVAPNGDQIVFSALNEDGTGDLWSVMTTGQPEPTQLLACPQAACNGASWSPDGRLLAFSRRNATDLAPPVISPPRLWLMDLANGEAAQVFADDQQLGFEPRWSGDGKWLSYLAPDRGGVGVYNLEDGRSAFFPSTTGEPGVWHPFQEQLLITQMEEDNGVFEVHIHLVDPQAGSELNLSRSDVPVEDNTPAWSPDGEWLAFRRKELEGPRASLGKQLWLMAGDGAEARPLTAAPEYDHGQPVWSPDGRYLLFHRLPLKGPDIVMSVWVLDVQTGAQWEIVRPGQRPSWAP